MTRRVHPTGNWAVAPVIRGRYGPTPTAPVMGDNVTKRGTKRGPLDVPSRFDELMDLAGLLASAPGGLTVAEIAERMAYQSNWSEYRRDRSRALLRTLCNVLPVWEDIVGGGEGAGHPQRVYGLDPKAVRCWLRRRGWPSTVIRYDEPIG